MDSQPWFQPTDQHDDPREFVRERREGIEACARSHSSLFPIRDRAGIRGIRHEIEQRLMWEIEQLSRFIAEEVFRHESGVAMSFGIYQPGRFRDIDPRRLNPQVLLLEFRVWAEGGEFDEFGAGQWRFRTEALTMESLTEGVSSAVAWCRRRVEGQQPT